MKIVDLKKEKIFVPEYIRLRNRFRELLLTKEVGFDETIEWLKNDNVETLGLAEGQTLMGAVILYTDRDGEVAVFTSNRGRGHGGLLLRAIENRARNNRLESIWAWVLLSNIPARKAFIKAGYSEKEYSDKIHQGKIQKGIIFEKKLER